MKEKIYLDILAQPDDITCGPTCLHAVYRYYEEDIPLNDVIEEVKSLEGGGTLAVFLGLSALKHGYKARLYTYDLQVFDPSWFVDGHTDLSERLQMRLEYMNQKKMKVVTSAYMDFLNKGGEIHYVDMTTTLLRKYLVRGIPILTGLSATHLYACPREIVRNGELVYDDIQGDPTGHFVLLTGYTKENHAVWIADPLRPNPVSETAQYQIDINHLICSIMLGILTYDANLLVVLPKKRA